MRGAVCVLLVILITRACCSESTLTRMHTIHDSVYYRSNKQYPPKAFQDFCRKTSDERAGGDAFTAGFCDNMGVEWDTNGDMLAWKRVRCDDWHSKKAVCEIQPNGSGAWIRSANSPIVAALPKEEKPQTFLGWISGIPVPPAADTPVPPAADVAQNAIAQGTPATDPVRADHTLRMFPTFETSAATTAGFAIGIAVISYWYTPNAHTWGAEFVVLIINGVTFGMSARQGVRVVNPPIAGAVARVEIAAIERIQLHVCAQLVKNVPGAGGLTIFPSFCHVFQPSTPWIVFHVITKQLPFDLLDLTMLVTLCLFIMQVLAMCRYFFQFIIGFDFTAPWKHWFDTEGSHTLSHRVCTFGQSIHAFIGSAWHAFTVVTLFKVAIGYGDSWLVWKLCGIMMVPMFPIMHRFDVAPWHVVPSSFSTVCVDTDVAKPCIEVIKGKMEDVLTDQMELKHWPAFLWPGAGAIMCIITVSKMLTYKDMFQGNALHYNVCSNVSSYTVLVQFALVWIAFYITLYEAEINIDAGDATQWYFHWSIMWNMITLVSWPVTCGPLVGVKSANNWRFGWMASMWVSDNWISYSVLYGCGVWIGLSMGMVIVYSKHFECTLRSFECVKLNFQHAMQHGVFVEYKRVLWRIVFVFHMCALYAYGGGFTPMPEVDTCPATLMPKMLMYQTVLIGIASVIHILACIACTVLEWVGQQSDCVEQAFEYSVPVSTWHSNKRGEILELTNNIQVCPQVEVSGFTAGFCLACYFGLVWCVTYTQIEAHVSNVELCQSLGGILLMCYVWFYVHVSTPSSMLAVARPDASSAIVLPGLIILPSVNRSPPCTHAQAKEKTSPLSACLQIDGDILSFVDHTITISRPPDVHGKSGDIELVVR